MKEIIAYYNEIKKQAKYGTDKKIKNYKNVEELKECTSDEVIEVIVNNFYDEDMDLEYIKENKDKEFIKVYMYEVMALEKEILSEISLKDAKSFIEIVKNLNELNNYHVLDEYFNGFYVGTKIVEEAFSDKYFGGNDNE